MWQQGAQSLTLILLLAVICARATPMPTAMSQEQELTTTEMVLEMKPESESEPESEPESKRIDCKLTFDATMGSLEQQQQQQQLLHANGCNVPHTSSTNKPTEQDEEKLSTSVLRHSMSGGSSQPLYELQLVVWPAGIEDVAVTTTPTTTTTTTTTTTPRPTTTTTLRPTTTAQTPSVFPLYEDQLVVFPQMDFEEENFDYFFDELETAATSTTTTRPRPTTASQPAVYVLENYRKRHPNGTEEHKLVLSNGLVNYMKHYAKRVDNKLINVQEGYSSVPVAGLTPQIQTLHYIADERGYNIYKIERSPLPSSVLPNRVLHKATKAPASKPHV
ncbi:hypothetical protein ACLKA6_005218 [Drosophila palustris]